MYKHPDVEKGQRIGRYLTALESTHGKSRGRGPKLKVKVACDCGTEFYVGFYNLMYSPNAACAGCRGAHISSTRRKANPLPSKIGAWDVLREIPGTRSSHRSLLVRHTCGWHKVTNMYRFKGTSSKFSGIRCGKCRTAPSVFRKFFDQTSCDWPPCHRTTKATFVDHSHECCSPELACWRCVRGLVHPACNLEIAYAEKFHAYGWQLPKPVVAYLETSRPLIEPFSRLIDETSNLAER